MGSVDFGSRQGSARVEVFVGPPGGGKTTTIAKIAAQARIATGRRFGLICTGASGERAADDARQYAGIIGTPFVAATTAAELRRALAAMAGPILVDVAGRCASRRACGTAASRCWLRRKAFAPIWCCPAPAPRPASDTSRTCTRRSRPTASCSRGWTRGVRSRRLPASSRRAACAVSYLGVGRRVPEDLERGTPAAIGAALIGDAIQTAERAA